MTIIDFMRQKLTEYPKISEFLVDGDIHVDFTEPGSSYGLSSNGPCSPWVRLLMTESCTRYRYR